MLCNGRADLTEDLATLLHKQFVDLADAFFCCSVEKAEVVSDVVTEDRLELRIENLKGMSRLTAFNCFDYHGGSDITKNKMRITITEIEVSRTYLGIHHQHTPGTARDDHIVGLLNTECGRRAGDIHVKGKAFDAELSLNFDSHRGVGPLHV